MGRIAPTRPTGESTQPLEPPTPATPTPATRPKPGLAIAALVLAVPSCFFWLGAPIAFLLGLVAYVLAVRNPAPMTGSNS